MFIYIILPILFFYSLYKYFTRTFNYWKNKKIRGPKPVAFFGNLKESTLRRQHITTVLQNIYEQFPDEKVVGIYRMTTPCLLLRDLDVIRNVMIKDFDTFIDRGIEFSKEGLGVNLFHSDGDTWKALRNRFSPIFTTSKLKNMVPLITERGDKFIDYIHNVCAVSREQEVHSLVQQYTIATIATCCFGLDMDTFSEDMKDMLCKIDKLLFDMNYAYELDMMYPGILKKLNSSLYPASATNFFHDLVRRVINQRNGKPSDRNDFMDLILKMREEHVIEGAEKDNNSEKITVEVTEGIIAALAFSFYAAGYETSSTETAFLLYQLALNPHIQDKLISEIDTVLSKYSGQLNYDSMNEMTYLDRIIDETLRMYPVVDPLQRNAKSDYKIPGTEITIKKGQTVIISLLGIHQDEKYYPNPEKFDPDRFTTEKCGERHSCAYLPFGAGPRNCIGLRLAKIQSRVCVIKLLSKFRVEPSKNTQLNMKFDPRRFLLTPKGGIYLNIMPRKI
ncbi:cytochrome P450 6B2-like [Anticarsia gemmatalis]|uniref:cytochrome P450 6B2-like n=1 Tax=Anticarsia gemmatalis TaxID=129554 RepID=UPI003F7731F6